VTERPRTIPRQCAARLRRTQHRHQLVSLGTAVGSSLNRQPAVVAKKLTPKIA
jgi:hypothetical protein